MLLRLLFQVLAKNCQGHTSTLSGKLHRVPPLSLFNYMLHSHQPLVRLVFLSCLNLCCVFLSVTQLLVVCSRSFFFYSVSLPIGTSCRSLRNLYHYEFSKHIHHNSQSHVPI
jgi:hypothetical protein